MKTPHLRIALAGVLLAGTIAGSAHAGTIAGTINTGNVFSLSNQSNDGTSYFNAPTQAPFLPVTIGEFDFSVPSGESITSATFSGNFGSNALGSGTAQVDLFLNGVAVGSCNSACALSSESADIPWTYAFTAAQLTSLSSGQAVLTALQKSVSQIVLDPTSVNVQTAPVPLPAAVWLFGSGLFSMVGFARRKVAAACA